MLLGPKQPRLAEKGVKKKTGFTPLVGLMDLQLKSVASLKLNLHQSRTTWMARRNKCFLWLPMDATVQHCPATVPAVTGIDRP